MMAIQNQVQKTQVYNLERYSRQAMHQLCSAVLSNHYRTCMSFGSFDIYRGDEEYVIFRPKKHITGNTCPGCGRQLTYDDMTFIQVQEERPYEDLVVWGCRKCGEIFTRIEYTGGDMDA